MTDIDPNLHADHEGASRTPPVATEALAWLTKRQHDILREIGVPAIIAELARAEIMAILIRAMEKAE